MNFNILRMCRSAHLLAKRLRCIATTASTPTTLALHHELIQGSHQGCIATSGVRAVSLNNKASESAASDLIPGAASSSTSCAAALKSNEQTDAQSVLQDRRGAIPQSIPLPAAGVVAASAVKGRPPLPHIALEVGADGRRPTTVAVAMSGGVDSAVTAKRLVDEGLQVLRFPHGCIFLWRPAVSRSVIKCHQKLSALCGVAAGSPNDTIEWI